MCSRCCAFRLADCVAQLLTQGDLGLVRVLAVEPEPDFSLDHIGEASAKTFVLGFHLHVVGLPAFDLLVQLVTGADELVEAFVAGDGAAK